MEAEIELPEPSAWLVTGGRTYHDKAFVTEVNARQSAAERDDGASLAALYTADQVRAAIAAERERCARVCEDLRDSWLQGRGRYEFMGEGADFCADAIRSGTSTEKEGG